MKDRLLDSSQDKPSLAERLAIETALATERYLRAGKLSRRSAIRLSSLLGLAAGLALTPLVNSLTGSRLDRNTLQSTDFRPVGIKTSEKDPGSQIIAAGEMAFGRDAVVANDAAGLVLKVDLGRLNALTQDQAVVLKDMNMELYIIQISGLDSEVASESSQLKSSVISNGPRAELISFLHRQHQGIYKFSARSVALSIPFILRHYYQISRQPYNTANRYYEASLAMHLSIAPFNQLWQEQGYFYQTIADIPDHLQRTILDRKPIDVVRLPVALIRRSNIPITN